MSVKDILKMYARKLLRVIPVYYAIFLAGWFILPHVTYGPYWYMM